MHLHCNDALSKQGVNCVSHCLQNLHFLAFCSCSSRRRRESRRHWGKLYQVRQKRRRKRRKRNCRGAASVTLMRKFAAGAVTTISSASAVSESATKGRTPGSIRLCPFDMFLCHSFASLFAPLFFPKRLNAILLIIEIKPAGVSLHVSFLPADMYENEV